MDYLVIFLFHDLLISDGTKVRLWDVSFGFLSNPEIRVDLKIKFELEIYSTLPVFYIPGVVDDTLSRLSCQSFLSELVSFVNTNSLI